jgi:hypothetical protein
MACYEAALDLVGQRLVGPRARHDWITKGWQRILPALSSVLLQAPGRIVAAVSNALHQLATTPGANPGLWIETMTRFGPECSDVETLLRLGQMAGWRSGLPHFRQGALGAANGLPPSLVLAVLGAAKSASWPDIQRRLAIDPWFDPCAAQPKSNEQNNRPCVTLHAGVFRGFGGLFLEPPRVAASGEHFLVRSVSECWLLTADIFGATFHRTSEVEFDAAARSTKPPTDLRIDDSKLHWQNKKLDISVPGKLTSVAANETTLALTTDSTHAVILIALK